MNLKIKCVVAGMAIGLMWGCGPVIAQQPARFTLQSSDLIGGDDYIRVVRDQSTDRCYVFVRSVYTMNATGPSSLVQVPCL